ncbi:MAG: carboxypeptidase regulatory-like domain-containing protein, partial [Acidobacteriia bacterium]|nr:carboxypeptidase regulatory-like domain-containing protein [Terriglobia bacterium]
MLCLRIYGVALLAMVGALPYAQAQPNTGAVRGVLTDNTGAVIPGANVSIAGAAATKTAGTQIDGSFSFSGLPAGQYTVRVAFPGFTPLNRAVTVDPGATAQVPLQLLLSSEKQVLTVQSEGAPAVSVEPDANATALVLRGQDLEALPDDPDDLKDALEALAGPAAGPSGAQMFVDGFSSGIMPPKESIREIRINQNPFSAEYDKLGMGRIEILTKPGTDKFHGAAYINDGNGIFNSRNPYVGNKPDYSNTMFGATLSGPLGKRASFFINVDQRNITNNATIHATTVDPTTLLIAPLDQAVLAPFRNTYVNPRLDYQLTPNHTLVARYQYVTSTQDDAGIGQFSLPSRAYASGTTEHNGQLTETAVLSAQAVNETRFQFAHTNTFQNGDNTVPTTLVASAFTGGGAEIGRSYTDIDHFELTNFTTVTHKTHTIRFGVRIRRDALTSASPENFGGTFSFFGVAAAPVLDANNQIVH